MQAKLSPDTKAMLARLRGCETRGIAFPHNYRYSGHHYGAYQYTWGPGSAGDRAGFRVRPDQASPAEQDVRTARFYPSTAPSGRAARRAAACSRLSVRGRPSPLACQRSTSTRVCSAR